MALLAAEPGLADAPPEPAGYRMGDYRAPTPATLSGALVVSVEEAAALWRDGAIFIDVMPRPPRPANLPPDTLWRSPPRDSVPGAVWLANTGFGDLAPESEAYFRSRLDAQLRARPGRAVVFFCLRDCWMSWNAAKRAIALGYRGVHWFPDGTDGWLRAGLPLAPVEPAP
jgi:PQQ-dependent catabolism-associated CXXCW motif protein